VEKAPSACTKCCEWYGKTPVGHFLSSRSAHTFNLVFAHLLFWTLAVPLVATNGYVTTNYAEAIAAQGTYGEIASGRWGQGCFPIVLAVTTIATLIWLESLVRVLVLIFIVFFLCMVVGRRKKQALTFLFSTLLQYFFKLTLSSDFFRSDTAKNSDAVESPWRNRYPTATIVLLLLFQTTYTNRSNICWRINFLKIQIIGNCKKHQRVHS